MYGRNLQSHKVFALLAMMHFARLLYADAGDFEAEFRRNVASCPSDLRAYQTQLADVDRFLETRLVNYTSEELSRLLYGRDLQSQMITILKGDRVPKEITFSRFAVTCAGKYRSFRDHFLRSDALEHLESWVDCNLFLYRANLEVPAQIEECYKKISTKAQRGSNGQKPTY